MDALFAWIRHMGPHPDSQTFLELAAAASAQLATRGPFHRELTALLETRQPRWERIREWSTLYRGERSDEDLLREELYDYAAALTVDQCFTTRLRRFERTRHLAGARARFRAAIEAAWTRYAHQPLSPQERTAETVVGHRLLVEGLAGWLEAIQEAERNPRGARAVVRAIAANRLLLAVQHQARRLRVAAAST